MKKKDSATTQNIIDKQKQQKNSKAYLKLHLLCNNITIPVNFMHNSMCVHVFAMNFAFDQAG